MLDTLGLSAALEWQANEFARRSSIKCKTNLCQDPYGLPVERATALFRIFQEILTNIARHSGATEFYVEMVEANGELTLTVRDNGIGVNQEQIRHPKSLGLTGMRERALIFNGTVLIEGQPGAGTTVKVNIPVGK